MNGQSIRVRFNATNGASPTLNVDGLGAKAIQSASGTAIGTGVLLANSVWDLVYDNSIPAFLVEGAAQVQTGGLANGSVTYAKIQNVTDQKVLGNVSGSAAAPSEIGFGTGIVISGGNITAPAIPVPAAFKNLSIKVATTTTVAVAADFVTVTDGTNYQTLAFSTTIDLGTTGAAALDTGTIATGTWYAIWAIAKADGTKSCIASTSAASPTMPSGYTYKARIGWVLTSGSVAQLYGTWQFGRRARYIVGLAALSSSRIPIAGSSGSVTTPTWTAVDLSGFVPSTASTAALCLFNASTSSSAMAAPSNNYGSSFSLTKPPPLVAGNAQLTNICGEFLLESTSVYYASAAVAAGLAILGWEDNI
jgi:hypothetical protein